MRDQIAAATGFTGPCFRTINGQPGRLPDADCYRFSGAQRIRGVAALGFESGSFYAGRTTTPAPAEGSDLWLSLEPNLLSGELRSRCQQGCFLSLDFIGRRTAVEGSYGHMGSAKHLIVIDRLTDVKPLG
jgi:hypothetical protein